MRRHRPKPGRTFVIVFALLVALAGISTLTEKLPIPHHSLRKLVARSAGATLLEEGSEKCLLVHDAKDQCAFIQKYCPDEEAGLLSYLTLYYCRLPHVKPLGFTIIALWTGLLFTTIGVAASDFFCVNLSTIASILGMSESMAGVTFLAFGNGSPDVFSTFAAMKSHSGSLAIGELIGAAGFITAVVSGSMALIRPFKVAKRSFVRDIVFFIVAVCFSMSFLANGSLDFWECAVMVAFYVFYVIVVVLWHYWLSLRRHKREQAAAARAHYVMPGAEELDFEEEYHDEQDEEGEVRSRHTASRRVSVEDFRDLELADDDAPEVMDDLDQEEARDKWMSEISSNMRVARTSGRDRRSTIKPIRPSLVGALEFRAVLATLQKSRNLQSEPINLRRRYSDDPYYTPSNAVLPDRLDLDFGRMQPTNTDVLGSSITKSRPGATRARAVSVNDAAGLCLDEDGFRNFRALDNEHMTASQVGDLSQHEALNGSAIEDASPAWAALIPPPTFSVTTPPLESAGDRHQSVALPGNSNLLAPPSPSMRGARPHASRESSESSTTEALPIAGGYFRHPSLHVSASESRRQGPGISPGISPGQSPRMSPREASRSGSSTPKAVGSFKLPPSASQNEFFGSAGSAQVDSKLSKWWPYSILPPPLDILHTLFPTLQRWNDKSILDKILALAAAPSFFLLTITLPVVDEEGDTENVVDLEPVTPLLDTENRPSSGYTSRRHSYTNVGHHASSASVAVFTEDSHHHNASVSTPLLKNDSALLSSESGSELVKPPGWNRWLVITQCFTAPYFVVFLVWANLEESTPRSLLLPTLYSLLGSLVALLILLMTTTPEKPPRWHFMLCFVGFAVSVTWISTIANEVVGVLKTIGVIFSMSDAILGLTIFAVGNSLGDLVADITVAKLGHPVMALSACFGGPLLNILLGIGLGGLYMTVHDAGKRHHKHPNSPTKYRPYHIEVSTTLLISAVALLVTLVGLLIAVPLNGWKMDRKIGIGLITLWSFATVGNVIVEVVGLGGDA